VNKIIVVGDLHANWNKINKLITEQQPDIVLQCGDFGWWPIMEKKDIPESQKTWKLKGIKAGRTKIYWCDGNHEEYSYLSQQGKVVEMYKNVYHCQRGSTITLPDGRIVLFAGGACSTDRHLRTAGRDWFPEENISQQDFDYMISHEHVDIVVSHTCPTEFDVYGIGIEGKLRDPNRTALSHVLEKYKPSLWFFGHWHTHETGTVDNTKWFCLDYPDHGRWWMNLP